MRRLLAVAALVAFMPTANAQDTGKTEFSTNAELRVRYFLMQNPGANEKEFGTNGFGQHRFKGDLHYKANEQISGHASLLYNGNWGQQVDGNPVTDNPQFLNVNEAYLRWMPVSELSMQLGRQNYGFADGFVMGVNDWQQMPYSYDGLLLNWEAEFGKIQFFGFKLRELDSGTRPSQPQTAGHGAASRDPEHNMYGLVFDLKSKPEWLKTVNVHLIKNNGDALIDGNGATTMNQSTDGIDGLRYGAMLGFAFDATELNLWYAAHDSKFKRIAAGGAKTEIDGKGNMMQAELAHTVENFMNSRVHFRYHQDSGNDGKSATENGNYDAFFYEQHNAAGMMDLFGWGNLTYMQLGWNFKPQDNTQVGLQYSMFSRTEASATSATYTQGLYGGFLDSQANDKDKLGDEIDLWATHHYDGGLSTTLRVGYFIPGDYFKDANTNNTDDAVMHIMLEGKATF